MLSLLLEAEWINERLLKVGECILILQTTRHANAFILLMVFWSIDRSIWFCGTDVHISRLLVHELIGVQNHLFTVWSRIQNKLQDSFDISYSIFLGKNFEKIGISCNISFWKLLNLSFYSIISIFLLIYSIYNCVAVVMAFV